MEIPVDLNNLRNMTDGDREMEKELFNEFYNSFEAGLNSLQESTDDSVAETWRKQAHALKGIALNLGTEQLSALCKKAQESQTVPRAIKIEMLGNMRAEYERVKVFLQGLH